MEEGIYWPTFFFLLSSAVACFFAFMVLVSTNIVRMAFYLVLSLAATSGLFFLAGQDFVGAMQLMIYVGGTLVLLIFGVMLTSQERFVRMHTSGGDWVLSLLVGGGLCAVLVLTALGVPEWQAPERAAVEAIALENTATPIGMGLLGARVDTLSVEDEVQRGGMGGYLLFFEIVSVHLLVVLVGAAYLARAKRKQAVATS
ncbi:MAG: NADH-quinone oxidoreductase subunit J [Planctomycetota bacterium]